MGSREKWLLSVLTGIFIIQSSVLIYGVHTCSKLDSVESITTVCPDLGERFDLTFGTMIATTLALLTGASLAASADKPKAPRYKPPTPGRK